MQKRNWLQALALASCAAALCVSTYAADGLPQSSKAMYKEIPSYLDICRDPKKFAPKDEAKVKFKIVFKAKTETLPTKYEDSYAKSYAMIIPEGDIPDSFTKVPIIYSNARGRVRDEITSLELSKPVILYATLRFRVYKDPKKKDAEPEKLYVLAVDDLEVPEMAIVIDNIKESEFTPAKSKRIDIQYDKYLGKKVAVTFRFKDIDNKIPNEIVRLTDITNETHFTILTQELFHTAIIAERANEKCVEPLLDLQAGDSFVLNGILTKADDPASPKHIPVYYFYVHSIGNSAAAPGTAPAAPAAPQPAQTAPLAAPEQPAPAPAAQPAAKPLPPLELTDERPAPPLTPKTEKPAPAPAPATKGSNSTSPLDDWKSILQEQAK